MRSKSMTPEQGRAEVARLLDLYGKAYNRYRRKKSRGVKWANPARANSIWSRANGIPRSVAGMGRDEFLRLTDEAVERWSRGEIDEDPR